MSVFSKLYVKTLSWSRHPKAPWYLGGMSFAESSFFPIPPDVMLMPMALSQPDKAMRFAWITTLASVAGGLFGYLIGYFLLDAIWPFIEQINYQDKYHQVVEFFDLYGVWIVFAAGFSPLPYKIFTIAAGATAMSLVPFLLASFIGRGARFFLVAGLMRWGGQRYADKIHDWIDWIGYGVLALITVYVLFKVFQ